MTNTANPRELRDIAVLMESMQKTTDRLRKRDLSVNLGTISLFNSTDGKLLGYMDPTENGEYTFTSTLDEDGMHADPVATMTGAITLPTAEAMAAQDATTTEHPTEHPAVAQVPTRRESLHADSPMFVDGGQR